MRIFFILVILNEYTYIILNIQIVEIENIYIARLRRSSPPLQGQVLFWMLKSF